MRDAAGARAAQPDGQDPQPDPLMTQLVPTQEPGDSNNTIRGYCLDIPRFEESLNN